MSSVRDILTFFFFIEDNEKSFNIPNIPIRAVIDLIESFELKPEKLTDKNSLRYYNVRKNVQAGRIV